MKCKICGASGLVGDLSPLSHFGNKHMDILLSTKASDSLNDFIRRLFIDEE